MNQARSTAFSPAALERLGSFVSDAALHPDAATLRCLRDGVVDVLGCILVGADTSVARKAQTAVRGLGAAGDRPVFGTDLRVSRPHAAFLNAVAGHALDFDDWEVPGNSHPTVVMIPALLAAADRKTSGADLTSAYLAGFEVIARLGEAMNFEHYDRGWHTTATLGALGSAAAVARLLALSPEQTTCALSLAVSRAAGYTCQFGSEAKPLQAGFAAQAGVECAYLAQAGLSGQPDVMHHAKGMAALMGVPDPARLDRALDKLGKPLALAEHGLVLKPWPSCGYTHRIMTCALELAPAIESAEDIQRIDLHLPDFHYAILPFDAPAKRAEALFSLHFVSAMGLARRGLNLADVARPSWLDPDISGLVRRTHVHPFAPKRPELNYDPDDPDRMEVTLRDGRRLAATCPYPLGAPQNPMTSDQIRAKFTANAGRTGQALLDSLFDWPASTSVLTLLDSLGENP
ncbi:MmgE/PrpD family protein [Ruegeria sediminis]|nr:MmgE/PrpD family protein [Ruegeria sediminis]